MQCSVNVVISTFCFCFTARCRQETGDCSLFPATKAPEEKGAFVDKKQVGAGSFSQSG